jgi:plastocyanin
MIVPTVFVVGSALSSNRILYQSDMSRLLSRQIGVSRRCPWLSAVLVSLCLTCVCSVQAETISGTIVIRRILTRPRVTAVVPLYQRGAVVGLGENTAEDPLSLERLRVALWIEGPGESATPQPVANLQQQDRRFAPEMLVIPAGSSVSFPNLDPIFHNVFSLSKPKSFDLGNYPQGKTRIVKFDQPGIVYVNCHLHPNMTAAIVVTPNRWNTRPGPDGDFDLSGVPPGDYTVVAWHKAAGFFRQTVHLEPGGQPKIDFLIPLDSQGNKLKPGVRGAGK